MPRSMSQHFAFVCSAQRKMWRRATGTPIVSATLSCESVMWSGGPQGSPLLLFNGRVANRRGAGWYPQLDTAFPQRAVVLLAGVLDQLAGRQRERPLVGPR